ncbi:hypothetical protein K438DRAFT_2073823 [Mycena galopus ATCC 62051]|nr:hypothetical protein K438DRAFT_2073823 [Mycena galopus ATCC 62051]
MSQSPSNTRESGSILRNALRQTFWSALAPVGPMSFSDTIVRKTVCGMERTGHVTDGKIRNEFIRNRAINCPVEPFGLLLLIPMSSAGRVKMGSIRTTAHATATDFVPGPKRLKPTLVRLVAPPASPETTAPADVPCRPSSPRSDWDEILPRPAPMTLGEVVLLFLPRASPPVFPAELLGPAVSYEEYLEEKEPERRASTELDYALDYGLFVPDCEVVVHVLGEAQEHQRVQELKTEAVLTGCPFENWDPIERYDAAAYDFKRKYGHVFTSNNGKGIVVGEMCRHCRIYQEVWETTDVEKEWKTVGKQWHGFRFTSPFAMGTERRLALDTELGFVIQNKDYMKPWSMECLKRFCQLWILKDDLEALENRANEESNRTSTLSTEEFAIMLRELFGEGK